MISIQPFYRPLLAIVTLEAGRQHARLGNFTSYTTATTVHPPRCQLADGGAVTHPACTPPGNTQ